MAKISLYLDTRKLAKDNKAPLNLRFSALNKTTAYIPTPYKLLPCDWDKNKQQIKKACKYYNAQAENIKINDYLNNGRQFLFDIGQQANNKTASELKNIYLQTKNDKNTDFFALIDEYANTLKIKNPTATTFESYISLKKILKKFRANIDINDIDFNFVNDFLLHLKSRNIKQNTLHLYFSKLRVVYNYAVDKGIVPYANNPLRKFQIKTEQTPHRTINIDDLRKVFDYQPTNDCEKMALDMFKLSFFLIGINIKDLLTIKPTDIYNNILTYKRAKTSKIINVRIEPETWQILDKYKGNEYLIGLKYIPNKYRDFNRYAKIAVQKINTNLKKIFARLNININATTYYARHTWATTARKIGIDYDIIRQAMGHSGGVTTIYIEYDSENIYNANRKVIDYVCAETSKKNNRNK